MHVGAASSPSRLGDESSRVETEHEVGRGSDERVVTHDDLGDAAGADGGEDLEHLLLARGVEGARRFVVEQARGGHGERAGDRDALALAAGEALRVCLDLVREAELTEQLPCGRCGLGGRDPAHDDRGEDAVLEDGEMRKELEGLEHQADPASIAASFRPTGIVRSPTVATRPLSATSRPARQRSSVVFPEPLAPTIAASAPAGTENDTSSSVGIGVPRW